jgi:histidinol dehydrogenase
MQTVTRKGLETIGNGVETLVEAEGLAAHANAVRARRE